MFNWVCPRCGKEVPPSKTECPYCVNQPQQAAPQAPAPPPGYQQQGYPPQGYPQQPPQQAYPPQGHPQQAPPPQAAWQPPAAPAPPHSWQPPQQWVPLVPQAPPPQPPVYAAPPPPPPPQQHYAAPPVAHPPADYAAHAQAPWPPQKQGPPAWLVGGGVAVALLVVLGLAYYSMQPSSGKPEAPADKGGSDKVAATSAAADKGPNPLQKAVEVVGVRVVTQDKKPVAKIVVVNHSLAEITGLEATVTLWASTKRSEEDSVGTFQIKVASLAPNGSLEVSAPFTTKLKPYEMPDWQNLTADLQITAPKL